MRNLLRVALAATFAAVLPAQTVGVTGFNDYWITPGGLPNSSSCAPLTINTPVTINMNVSTAPGTPYVIFWSFCGCVPCAPVPAFASSGCLPGPTSACPSSNQFLEVVLFGGCVTFALPGMTNSAGFGTTPLPVPATSPPITLGTQVAFLGPVGCTVAPFNVLVSPAWNVTFQ